MNDKDIVEQYIRDLKSVSYYNKKIISINLKLEELSIKMQGVSSPSMQGTIIENGSNNYQHNLIEYLSREEKLLHERVVLVKRIYDVQIVFDNLSKKIQKIIIDCYLLNKKHSSVANKYGYDRSYMYRKINKSIIKLLKK